MNQENIQNVIKQLLISIGENPERDGLKDTPARIARAYKDWFRGYRDPEFKMTTFESKYSGIVIRKKVPFISWCEHHMAPYNGFIDFAYIPNGEVVGISKIVVYLQWRAARLTIQEQLTEEIADYFNQLILPLGTMVIITGFHTCESSREVKNAQIPLITSTVTGVFYDKPTVKDEALQLLSL